MFPCCTMVIAKENGRSIWVIPSLEGEKKHKKSQNSIKQPPQAFFWEKKTHKTTQNNPPPGDPMVGIPIGIPWISHGTFVTLRSTDVSLTSTSSRRFHVPAPMRSFRTSQLLRTLVMQCAAVSTHSGLIKVPQGKRWGGRMGVGGRGAGTMPTHFTHVFFRCMVYAH